MNQHQHASHLFSAFPFLSWGVKKENHKVCFMKNRAFFLNRSGVYSYNSISLFHFLQKRKRREKDDDVVSLCSLDFKVMKTGFSAILCNHLLCRLRWLLPGNAVLSVFAFHHQQFRDVYSCVCSCVHLWGGLNPASDIHHAVGDLLF